MKKLILASIILFTIYSCSSDDDQEIAMVNFSLNFSHNWNDTIPISSIDFDDIKFKNENGDSLSIERLRYLISDVTLINQNGDTIITDDYNLVDVTNDENLTFTISEKVPVGTYSKVNFTFGFDDEDNVDGIYADLNTANFNIPTNGLLNGGYHFMQFDGKFINSFNQIQGFNYHTIAAVNKSDPNNIIMDDTSFSVELGEVEVGGNTTVEVAVNLAEWFKTPNLWNLNELNSVLMPNYNAQILMNANGQSVFSVAK